MSQRVFNREIEEGVRPGEEPYDVEDEDPRDPDFRHGHRAVLPHLPVEVLPPRRPKLVPRYYLERIGLRRGSARSKRIPPSGPASTRRLCASVQRLFDFI